MTEKFQNTLEFCTKISFGKSKVFFKNIGWVGYDVSNGIAPDSNYILIAKGFDFNDVVPVKGVKIGISKEVMKTNIIIDNIHFTKSFLLVSISNLLATIIFSGRPGGTRTPNLRFWRPMLYQLSHWPIFSIYSKTNKPRQSTSAKKS